MFQEIEKRKEEFCDTMTDNDIFKKKEEYSKK